MEALLDFRQRKRKPTRGLIGLRPETRHAAQLPPRVAKRILDGVGTQQIPMQRAGNIETMQRDQVLARFTKALQCFGIQRF